jgi:uncharacterized protein (TIGR02246 family)
MASAAESIVATITDNWAAAFAKLDSSALASLYSRNALFFGSNPTLYRGIEGVKSYFDGLPRWPSPRVQFSDLNATQLGHDVVSFAGTATFFLEQGAEPLVVKITWVIVREDGGWKIVSHHVSSKTPLIAH